MNIALPSGCAEGQWATSVMQAAHLAAPSLITYECANVIRRHELAGVIGSDQAAQAHADLLDLAIEILATRGARDPSLGTSPESLDL